jgi:AICAR transformylase/IMP cyclohydrolase PurH
MVLTVEVLPTAPSRTKVPGKLNRNAVAGSLQPSGSKADDEVIAAVDKHGLAMVFSGMRHFWH